MCVFVCGVCNGAYIAEEGLWSQLKFVNIIFLSGFQDRYGRVE